MEIENRLVISRVREEVRVDVTIQGQQEGILKMMKMFCILTVSMPTSSCDIILSFSKRLPLGDSLYYFLYTHVPTLPQN